MRSTFFYSFTLLLFFNTSCGVSKTKLSKSDLKWIDVYNEGDTLVFKSEKGDFDTTYIIKKETFYPEYNPIEVHDKYLPQWGVVWYKNKNLKYHPDGYKLVEMIKKDPKKQTWLFIDYLYSKVMVLDLTTGEIEKYKHGKVYEFDTYHPKSKPNEPKKIFWHEDYGIIKYITHADVMWERINPRSL